MLFIHLKTLFSFRFYHQLILAKKRLLVFFALYLWLLSILMVYFASSSFLKKNLPVFLKNFPQVTFDKGFLTAPQQPVEVTLPDSNIQLIFDASEKALPPQTNAQTPLLWVNQNNLYLFANGQTQIQPLPKEMTFTSDAATLEKYKDDLLFSLKLAVFIVSLLLVPFVLFLSFCLAFSVGLSFKLFRLSAVPLSVVARWAFFMLGPLTVLWYIRLWVRVPLFSLAQVILCIIYMQQIFNLIVEKPHEN